MANADIKIELIAEFSAITSLLAEIPKYPPEVIEAVVDAFEGGVKLVDIEAVPRAAPFANQIVVSAKPSERFLRILAAARTGD